MCSLGHFLEFFSFQPYFFCVLYFRHHINIKYILEITYGTLEHIENLQNNL
jgi:hypothetical protein